MSKEIIPVESRTGDPSVPPTQYLIISHAQPAVTRSRPNQITGPGPKSGPAGKSESRGLENGVSRWRRPNLDIYSQNYHFGLVYDGYNNFLAWRQRIISLVCFANNAIRPWPQVMPIFDREMPPGFTPAICLRHNFVYISILENRGDKSLDQNFWNIVFNSYANFREKLSKALTARPQKPKLGWILKQIFQDGGHRTCTRTLGRKHTRKSASFW